jgi:pimeloyl-ACP methyl ester carboxylesterase
MKSLFLLTCFTGLVLSRTTVSAQSRTPTIATPTDVKPGSITCEDVNVAHNEAAWTPEFEKYTRIRYAWTLSADWPRLAMVQTLISQVQYLDQVVDDWSHIKAPTLIFGGAEDTLPGSAEVFRERMKFVADSIPNGNGHLHLIPGLEHVAHMEAPDRTFPPLVAFLKEGLAGR